MKAKYLLGLLVLSLGLLACSKSESDKKNAQTAKEQFVGDWTSAEIASNEESFYNLEITNELSVTFEFGSLYEEKLEPFHFGTLLLTSDTTASLQPSEELMTKLRQEGRSDREIQDLLSKVEMKVQDGKIVFGTTQENGKEQKPNLLSKRPAGQATVQRAQFKANLTKISSAKASFFSKYAMKTLKLISTTYTTYKENGEIETEFENPEENVKEDYEYTDDKGEKHVSITAKRIKILSLNEALVNDKYKVKLRSYLNNKKTYLAFVKQDEKNSNVGTHLVSGEVKGEGQNLSFISQSSGTYTEGPNKGKKFNYSYAYKYQVVE